MANEFETVRVIALEDEASGPEEGQYLLIDSADGTKKMKVEDLLRSADLSENVKTAFLNCFAHVAWADEYGQDYYDALEDALYPGPYPKITATFTKGNHTVYVGSALSTITPYLTVIYYETAASTGRTLTSSEYSLSGNLSSEINRIQVSYNNCTANVVIPAKISGLPSGYTPYDYIKVYNNDTLFDQKVILSTNQIFLPITGNKNNYKYIFDVNIPDMPSSATVGVFGGREATGNVDSLAFYMKDDCTKIFFHAHGGEAESDVLSTLEEGKISHIQFNPSANPTEVDVDETELTFEWSSSTQTMEAVLALFGNPSYDAQKAIYQNVGFYLQLGKFEVYNQSNDLICRLIPCANSSSKYGMYDTVSETFLTSNSESTYTCGNWQ